MQFIIYRKEILWEICMYSRLIYHTHKWTYSALKIANAHRKGERERKRWGKRTRGNWRVQTPHSCWQTAKTHMSYVPSLIRFTIHNSQFTILHSPRLSMDEHKAIVPGASASVCARCIQVELGMHVSDSDILGTSFPSSLSTCPLPECVCLEL